MSLKLWQWAALGAGVYLLAGGRKANAAVTKGPEQKGIYEDREGMRFILSDDAIEQDGAILTDSTPGLAMEPATGTIQWSDGKSQTYAMASSKPSQWVPVGLMS